MESLQFLLDTHIVSHLVRQPQGIIRDRIAEVGEQTVGVSLLVAAELRFGAAKKQSARLAQQVEAVLSVLPILPLETPDVIQPCVLSKGGDVMPRLISSDRACSPRAVMSCHARRCRSCVLPKGL